MAAAAPRPAADNPAATALALAQQGADVRLLLPGLPAVMEAVQGARTVVDIGACFGALRVRLLQARLLRVLDERVVTPLGSDEAQPVDFQLLSASHRHLGELVADGRFREDLFYRLAGIELRLPALRERTDFDLVVQKIVRSLCENGQHIGISAQVMDIFKRYHWPGNFRQLHNLLRTAVVMVGCDGVIGMEHLPDDFIERPRLSQLFYAGQKKITRLPRRSVIVAFSADEVYAIAELVKRQRGGAAVVLGALSPRTRNAQVAL